MILMTDDTHKGETEHLVTLMVCHNLEPDAKQYLKDHLQEMESLTVHFHPSISEAVELTESVQKQLSESEILLGYNFPLAWLRHASNLKLIISPFAGVKPLVQKLKQLQNQQPAFKNVIVTNSHGNARFVAQHALSLLFTLTGQIIHHHRQMERGVWQFKEEEKQSYPLFDKTIGLLGYGAINQHVHQYLSGLPIKFHVLKNSWGDLETYPNSIEQKYQPAELHSFLRAVDIVILALPLTQETKGWIGAKELHQLGSESLLINMARGPIVQEKALFTALNEEWIRGASIDVWYDYTPTADEKWRKFPYNYPFHDLENIVLSPHRADSPFDDLSRWDDVFVNIQKFLRGDTDYINEVDLEKEY